jgi:hypothetical protein
MMMMMTMMMTMMMMTGRLGPHIRISMDLPPRCVWS